MKAILKDTQIILIPETENEAEQALQFDSRIKGLPAYVYAPSELIYVHCPKKNEN